MQRIAVVLSDDLNAQIRDQNVEQFIEMTVLGLDCLRRQFDRRQ